MRTALLLLALTAASAPSATGTDLANAQPAPLIEVAPEGTGAQAAAAEDPGILARFEQWVDYKMGRVNVFIAGGDDPETPDVEENAFGFFQKIPIGVHDGDGEMIRVPLLVLWLVLGSIIFTLRMSFVQFRVFRHAIAVTRGRYDNPDDEGEVSHFQALTAALSATVGLGNIAGVAIAISIGGPGATFWMIMAGFLGMASKFVECTLGQLYREVRADGTVEALPSKITNLTIRAGDLIEMEMPGGGGYGAPTAREPARVLDDLLDGKITPEAASEIYGIVVNDGALDIAATETRRAELKAGD